MLTEIKKKEFKNGVVYALKTEDNFLIETTSTFLPYYTKNAIGRKQNKLDGYNLGSYFERYLVGISCMSGCCVGCKFCATGQMKKYRNLTAEEMVDQVDFIVAKNNIDPNKSKEFKLNYTRMGEPALNIDEVKKAIKIIDLKYQNVHHYISTIGMQDDDFSWIKDNITLQISLHSLNEDYRNWLIPIKNKMSLEQLGQIRTFSNLKTTLNLTLTNNEQLDIEKLRQYFDPKYFFIKLSPLNENLISQKNNMTSVIKSINLL